MIPIPWLVALGALLASPAIAKPAHPLSPGAHQLVVNDVRLWYRVAGRSSGIPVVYLHGGPGQGSQSFARLAGPFLERSQRIVYLDQRGAGRSERPWNDAYSIALMVDDVEQLRRAWGVPKIALIGHSFGTVLAMEYAARYPDRVDRMVLAAAVPDIQKAFDVQCEHLQRSDPAAYARAVAARPAGWRARCDMMHAYAGEERERVLTSYMFPKPDSASRLKAADEEGGLRNTGVVGAALFRQGLLDYRFSSAARVRAPVLVVAGTKDLQAVIETQRALAGALPNARLAEFDGDGHFMWVEEPERFGREVAAFLGGR